jgi:hypothetical protein
LKLKFILALLVLAAVAASAQAQSAIQNNYIPSEIGGDNYYNFYGGPDLSASISGTNEFDRGDTVTLYVDLTNYGRITGFKQDQIPQNAKEFALQAAELQDEYKKPTALGITGSLVSNSPSVEVQSGDQVIQSLKSGEKTQSPLKFTLKIANHAKAGSYPLSLKLSYDYQSNVLVYASDLAASSGTPSLSGFRETLNFQKANQTLSIPLIVKKKADFNITSSDGTMSAGVKKSPIEVTYQNTGDEPITDGIARLSIFKPFSSTDDQAYIGTMSPGESKTVTFRLDVDSDATPKDYGINSEIKYTDVRGDTVISESMKIPVVVTPAAQSLMLPALVALIVLIAIGGYVYKKKQKKA